MQNVLSSKKFRAGRKRTEIYHDNYVNKTLAFNIWAGGGGGGGGFKYCCKMGCILSWMTFLSRFARDCCLNPICLVIYNAGYSGIKTKGQTKFLASALLATNTGKLFNADYRL